MNPRRDPCKHEIIAKGHANDDEVSDESITSILTRVADFCNTASSEHSRLQSLGWPATLPLPRNSAILQ